MSRIELDKRVLRLMLIRVLAARVPGNLFPMSGEDMHDTSKVARWNDQKVKLLRELRDMDETWRSDEEYEFLINRALDFIGAA